MKRKRIIHICLFLLSISLLTACEQETKNKNRVSENQKNVNQAVSDTERNEKIEKNTTVNEPQMGSDTEDDLLVESAKNSESIYKTLSGLTFIYASGAGAWGTELTIYKDGSFYGHYHDSEMGEVTDDAPNGTIYLSEFTGEFGEPTKIDDFTYQLPMDRIVVANPEGTEKIVDGSRIVYSEPIGLNDTKEVYLYLPGKPVSELPKEFTDWLSVRLEAEEAVDQLSFYGLYNALAKVAFSSSDYHKDNKILVEINNVVGESLKINEHLQEKDLTQMEMNQLAGELYTLWDKELNLIWKELKNYLNTDSMNRLLQEQREWIAFKEAEVKKEGEPYEGGSMQPMVKAEKAAQLTKERVYILVGYLFY